MLCTAHRYPVNYTPNWIPLLFCYSVINMYFTLATLHLPLTLSSSTFSCDWGKDTGGWCGSECEWRGWYIKIELLSDVRESLLLSSAPNHFLCTYPWPGAIHNYTSENTDGRTGDIRCVAASFTFVFYKLSSILILRPLFSLCFLVL